MRGRMRRLLRQGFRRAVEAGLPPSVIGWRQVRRVPPEAYLAEEPDRVETIHLPGQASNQLPRNVESLAELNPDSGWWGFSFRDVPTRRSGPTRLVRLNEARVVSYGGGATGELFHPALLMSDGRSLELDQIVFRPPHAPIMRRGILAQRHGRATWILERVYDNHSHWLTAHLPKLILLRDRGLVEDVLLPRHITPVMETSLRILGLDPRAFARFDFESLLEVQDLTVMQTDRFRPELLRPVRDALAPGDAVPFRRVFVSRARSKGRRLMGEEGLWPALQARGFNQVFMEELDFPAQIRLMTETSVLVAPHGAGLTNMMFCAPGAHVIEIADVAYPNPNFYALAAAMGLNYWLVPAEGVGEGHALGHDLRVAPEVLLQVVDLALSGATA